jgi:hypothetical protein
MKTNFMIQPASAILLATGTLCLGSVNSALASEYGDDPNPPQQSSTKSLAGDREIINAENQPPMAQDKETSLQMRAETPMPLSEPSTSTP